MAKERKLEHLRAEIIHLYKKENYTIQQLVDWLQASHGIHAALGTVTRTLEIWNVQRDKPSRHVKHYQINHKALDDKSDAQVQEWLKFLSSYSNLGNQVVIVSTKPELLDKMLELRDFLNTSKPVELPKQGRIRLRIYSKTIWNRINEWKQQQKAG